MGKGLMAELYHSHHGALESISLSFSLCLNLPSLIPFDSVLSAIFVIAL